MNSMMEDYLDRLAGHHQAASRALEGLAVAWLDWAPGPGMNSLAILATHMAGAERYWIGEVVGGEPAHRVREEEFRTRGQEAASLIALLERTLAHSRSVLERLAVEDMAMARLVPPEDERLRVAWCLDHALGHAALHLGHMQITRELIDQRAQENPESARTS